MKIHLIILLILFSTSCSPKKSGGNGKFKLLIGNVALETTMHGGAFTESHNLETNLKSVFKLDSNSSIEVPQSLYNFLFVAFSGPNDREGTMYCGSVDSIKLTSTETTVPVIVSSAACSEAKFTSLILKIKDGSVAKWDIDKFDQSRWGP